MSRRASAKPTGIQMFPFLAVLICTMGALVVLLHAFARHGQMQAIKVATARVEAQRAQQFTAGDIQWRIDQLLEARTKTQAQLDAERLKLAHVEDHQRRLQDKLARLKLSVAELERAAAEDGGQGHASAVELEAVKAELEETRRELEKALAQDRGQSVNYSVVAYEGRHATGRPPIYIECREDLIILQPEGIELRPSDFGGSFGPGNPLAAAIRAKREYMARQAPGGQLDQEPYPLFLVRPDGIMAYNYARMALDSWGSDFGYELLASDWDVKYPEPDPQLIGLTRKVVSEARLRHLEYVQSSPSASRQRSRPVYHARSHGGFAAEGEVGGTGDTGGRGSGGWDGDNPWSNPGSSRGSGEGWSAGTDGDANSFDWGGGGRGQMQDPYADSNGAGAPGLRGGSGSTSAGSGRPSQGSADSGAACDTDSLLGQGGAPGGPQGDSPHDPSGRGGPPNASAARGPGGEANGEQQSGDSSFDQSGQAGSSKLNSGSRASSSGEGTPNNDGSSPDSAAAGSNGGGKPSSSHSSTGSKPHSIASVRGENWGLPESGTHAVAATRPILVQCYADRLVIASESRGQAPREIRLTPRTEDSMDELVSAVWDHMKSWGSAGRGLYWRPALSIDVQPGGGERYTQIHSLLADSGLDVKQRDKPQPRPAAPPGRSSRPFLRER